MLPSTNIVFNQYRDNNDQVDLPNAATIRTMNLRCYMAEATETASILVVGEAAGPWGCRFSGVPFTGERQLLDPSFPIHGERSSKTNLDLPTKINPPFISISAKIFWGVMLPYYGRFLLWDAFPFHSHKPQDFLTVRNPTKSEVSIFGEALQLIKAYMKPINIVTVGKRAFEELDSLGEHSIYVRHPSQGGKAEFISGMQNIFEDRTEEIMVILKTFEKKDIPALLDWIKGSDAEFLIQFAGSKYRFPLDEKQLLDTLYDKRILVFKAIDETKTGVMIGHCQLMKIDLPNKSATIGRVLIKPDKRGLGYGYAMLKELINYATSVLKLKHLNLRVFDFNQSAIRCYLKLGFVESKREEVFFPAINQTWNCITMEYHIS